MARLQVKVKVIFVGFKVT